MVEEWLRDTTPAAQVVYIEIHRRMSEAQRLARVFEMIEVQKAMAESFVRQHYPNADDREVFLRVTANRLGPELMMRAYGWDPASGS